MAAPNVRRVQCGMEDCYNWIIIVGKKSGKVICKDCRKALNPHLGDDKKKGGINFGRPNRDED